MKKNYIKSLLFVGMILSFTLEINAQQTLEKTHVNGLNSQNQKQSINDGDVKASIQKIVASYDQEKLTKLYEETKAKEEAIRAKAIAFAEENNIPLRLYNEDGSFAELNRIAANGTPIYNTLYNVDAAISTRANYLNTGGGLGLNLNGDGLTAHVWDGGPTRPTHQEFDGTGGTDRVTINDGVTALNGNSFHAQHVTGTIVASGFQAAAKGMAWQADALTHEWTNDLTEATTEAASGMILSNHSYGFNASAIPDDWFGQYGPLASDWDNLLYNTPYYLMVVAAGNDGGDNSSNGAPLDGETAYDKLSGRATAKNNLVVANGNDANINPDGSLNSVTRNSSSSEGPTDDYRIKPDIMANGTALYSTFDNADNAYNSITGTSMASPNACGTALLLQEHYNNLNGSFMRAASLKGLILHTADDTAANGPDANTGWGLFNAKFAAETITTDNANGNAFINELTLTPGQTYQITVTADGINPLLASISWTDPVGTLNNGTNSNTPALVNDLDIRLDNGTTYMPWRLTGVTTNGTGDNLVDPYERIDINGASGQYTLTVTHKGTLTNGSQDFTLIVTGASQAAATPQVGFNSTIGSNIEGTDCSFTDISIPLNIAQAPSADADVTLTINGGTATDGVDYQLLTSNVTFPMGATAGQNITLRVFSDGFIEGDETVIIDLAVNANGGDASANPNADSLTFTINDDDVAPVSSSNSVLFSSNFEASDTNTWSSIDADGDGNVWVGVQGVAYTGIDGVFIGSESDGTVLGNGGNFSPDNFVHHDVAISIPAGTTNVNFNYGIGAFQGAGEPYETYWTTDISSAAAITSGLLIDSGTSAANAGEIRDINVTTIAGQTGYFVVRHVSPGTTSSGIILLDNITITATITAAVQTAVNNGTTNDQLTLSGAGTIYASDSTSDDIMLHITNNNSHDYGCVDIAVARAGTGAQSYNGSVAPNLVMDKTFYINPANVAASGDATVTFYFTEAEIAGWESATGASRNDLEAIRDDSGAITFAPDNSINATETSTLTIGSFGPHVTLTGTFSGLSGGFAFGTQTTLSIDDNELLGVSLYPNPTRNEFNISGLTEVTKVNVYDITGKLVLIKTDYLNGPINTSELQSGIYLVNITNTVGNKVTKLVIK